MPSGAPLPVMSRSVSALEITSVSDCKPNLLESSKTITCWAEAIMAFLTWVSSMLGSVRPASSVKPAPERNSLLA